MLGENRRSERMFYYVRIEDIVPENHLLRLIDRHIGLKLIRNKVKLLYSHTGRPSVDPEVLLRMLLIGSIWNHVRASSMRRGNNYIFMLPIKRLPHGSPQNYPLTTQEAQQAVS